MSLSFPSTIASFQIERLLGLGATAQVFLARDLGTDSEIALKVLHPHLSDSPAFAARFEHQARALGDLDHPGIVPVQDYGLEDGYAYLVMDYVSGPSLATYLRERGNRPVDVGQAARLAEAVADALAYAHGQGVVHRDVKPANILLRDGRLDRPVLTDFGLARLVEATLDTASGATVGTPAYISPEQGQGQPADARSDVYALGVVLFEVLTGRPPFQAESPYALVLHHVHTPPPRPRDLRPDLPQALEKVILQALAKDPADRYPSAAAFAAALRQSRLVPQKAEVSPPRRLFFVLTGLGAALVVALALAWFSGWLPVAAPGNGAVAARHTPTVETLVLQGAPTIREAWLDPDLPEQVSAEDPKVHLQGPSTPDRVAYQLTPPDLPPGTEVLTVTLALYTVPWGEDNRYAAVAAHRLLVDWDPDSASYLSPWTAPGLQPDVDYVAEPFWTSELSDLLTNKGWLVVDITLLAQDWLAGEPNHGLLLRLTDDSFGMAHWWVYTGRYEDPNLRPKLALTYRRP